MAIRHDAFISYSHAADSKLATALEKGLEKLAKPLLKLRALDIFRDQTSLTASPALWPGIVAHLSASEWLLLLASPASAASVWCNKEVQWWLDNRSPDRLLIVLTEGDIVWNAASTDFDWSRTTAIPKLLARRCEDEPLYVDLRWARGSELLSLRNAQFRDAVVNVAAPIRGVAKDELDGVDLRQLARNRLLVRGGVAAISIAAGVAIWQAIVANQQRAEAVRQRDIAVARQLGAQAELMRSQQPERLPLALLMATESARLQPESIEAQQTLRAVLSQFPIQTGALRHSSAVTSVAFNGDRTLAATAGSDGALWKLPEASRFASLPGANHVVVFSPDGSRVAGCCERVGVWRQDGGAEGSLTASDLRGAPRSIVFRDDGKQLAIGFEGASPGFAVYDVEARAIVARHEIDASGNATALAFGRRGALFFAPRTAIEVRSTADWKLATTLEPDIGAVHRLAVSPSGRYLAASGDSDVVVFDLQDGGTTRLQARSMGPGMIEELAFDANERYLAAVGSHNTGSVWRLDSWREAVAPSHGEFQTIHSASFDPDSREIVSCGDDGNCFSWSLASGRRLRQFAHVYAHTGEEARLRQMSSSVFARTNGLLMTGGADGTARLWQFSSGEDGGRFACEVDRVDFGTFLTHARSWSNGRGQLERVAPECLMELPDAVLNGTLASGPGGDFVAAALPGDAVHVWNARNGHAIARLDHSTDVDWGVVEARLKEEGTSLRLIAMQMSEMQSSGSSRALAVSASGKRIVTMRRADRTLRVWDVEANRVLYSETITAETPALIELISDSSMLRVEQSGDFLVMNIDGSIVWSADHGPLASVALTREGAAIAVSYGKPSRQVRVHRASDGKVVMHAQAPHEIGDLVFDRTGRYLVGLGPFSFVPTGLPTGVAVTVWDTDTQRELMSLPATDGTIALDFSVDQRRFAAMSNSGELRLWTLPDGNSARAITLDPGPIAFSRSGRWLAMGSRSVRIIDTASARAVAQLDLGGEIRGLEFRDDDSLIAALRFESGAQDGVVEVHRWRPEDMLADACRRMPVDAAEKQWRQLLPDQPVPSPCAMLSAPARTL